VTWFRYRAQGIRPLRRCWRGWRWVGGECTWLLIHYTMLSTILKLYTLCFFWYCHQVTRFTCTCATQILATAVIQEWRLFCSVYPEVWLQFKSGE